MLLFVLLSLAVGRSQTPFTTDDADVTDVGRTHFELVNEFATLPRSEYPSRARDTLLAQFAFGIHKNIEIGLDVPLVALFNAGGVFPRRASGLSDVRAHVKVKIKDENEHSRLPAFAVAFYSIFPTGRISRSLGGGVTDHLVYGILQKSLTTGTKFRANAGVLFAGRMITGVQQTAPATGKLFTGGISFIRRFTNRLELGVEIVGVQRSRLYLNRGQLQTTVGGNYGLKKDVALTFGAVIGRFPSSPRAGAIIGFTFDL